jgi:hypothetical protein
MSWLGENDVTAATPGDLPTVPFERLDHFNRPQERESGH